MYGRCPLSVTADDIYSVLAASDRFDFLTNKYFGTAQVKDEMTWLNERKQLQYLSELPLTATVCCACLFNIYVYCDLFITQNGCCINSHVRLLCETNQTSCVDIMIIFLPEHWTDDDWLTRHATLYSACRWTASQCNWCSTGMMCSSHIVPVISHAAAFWLDCETIGAFLQIYKKCRWQEIRVD